jgi:hypothetical protein
MVAADLRVRTESSDTRARSALVSWPLGPLGARRKFVRRQVVKPSLCVVPASDTKSASWSQICRK